MARKTKDIDQLLRLQNWAVDERRRELGAFLAREGTLLDQGEAMDRQLIAEQEVARKDTNFAGQIFAGYFENHLKRKEHLAVLLVALQAEINSARERLADAYREQKILEEVHKERLRLIRVEELHDEQVELDEIAQIQHFRKQN